jgi:hypothetical protein
LFNLDSYNMTSRTHKRHRGHNQDDVDFFFKVPTQEPYLGNYLPSKSRTEPSFVPEFIPKGSVTDRVKKALETEKSEEEKAQDRSLVNSGLNALTLSRSIRPSHTKLEDLEKVRAKLSKAASIVHEAGVENAQSYLDQIGLEKYKIDPMSNSDGMVVKGPDGVEMAWRGSQANKLADWKTNAQIAFGQEAGSQHMTDALEMYDRAVAKYGTVEHVSGFSLGGKTALHVGQLRDVPTTAFNPHLGIAELNKINPSKPATILRTSTDVASVGLALSKVGDKVTVKSFAPIENSLNPWDSHLIKNFTDRPEDPKKLSKSKLEKVAADHENYAVKIKELEHFMSADDAIKSGKSFSEWAQQEHGKLGLKDVMHNESGFTKNLNIENPLLETWHRMGGEYAPHEAKSLVDNFKAAPVSNGETRGANKIVNDMFGGYESKPNWKVAEGRPILENMISDIMEGNKLKEPSVNNTPYETLDVNKWGKPTVNKFFNARETLSLGHEKRPRFAAPENPTYTGSTFTTSTTGDTASFMDKINALENLVGTEYVPPDFAGGGGVSFLDTFNALESEVGDNVMRIDEALKAPTEISVDATADLRETLNRKYAMKDGLGFDRDELARMSADDPFKKRAGYLKKKSNSVYEGLVADGRIERPPTEADPYAFEQKMGLTQNEKSKFIENVGDRETMFNEMNDTFHGLSKTLDESFFTPIAEIQPSFASKMKGALHPTSIGTGLFSGYLANKAINTIDSEHKLGEFLDTGLEGALAGGFGSMAMGALGGAGIGFLPEVAIGAAAYLTQDYANKGIRWFEEKLGVNEGSDFENATATIGSAAAAGALAGSFIPGFGTLAGAGLGALAGGASYLFNKFF